MAAPTASAQFGKNKVQYETFDFRVLETDHFLIHYYPETESAILDAARMAERAYARLSKVFRHEFKDKKPLILYASQSDFQQTNIFRFQLSEGIQGVTEGLRDRIVLFFPSSYPEFEHTLMHELVHSFQYDIMRRGALSQGSNPFAFRPPLWFMEGMAEYLTTGAIGSQTAMWLRDGALSGYLTSLPELSRVGDIRVYRFGQAIFYYVGTKYGDEKIGEIMQRAPLIGVENAFEQSLNRSVEELSREWLEAVRLTYLPQVVRHPTAGESARRLTNHHEHNSQVNLAPAVSPDGRRVAFISDRDYFNDIYVADVDDFDDVDKLVKGERTASFESLRFLRAGLSFSPDGRYLAFSSKAGEQDALYIMRVGDEKIVGSHRFGLEGIETPSWSPDGTRLVFTGLQGGVSDLYVVGRDGSGLERLTDDPYSQRDPAWSPDGTRIAYTTEFGPGTDFDLLAWGEYRIAILDLASGETSYLAERHGKNINPQWGPGGRKIAFISDRTGIPNIFLHDFDQDATYQLTDLLTGVTGIIESSPAISWSANGERIVFSAFSDAGWDLYSLDDPLGRIGEPWVPADRAEYELAARAFVPPVAPLEAGERSRRVEEVGAGEEPAGVGAGEEPPDEGGEDAIVARADAGDEGEAQEEDGEAEDAAGGGEEAEAEDAADDGKDAAAEPAVARVPDRESDAISTYLGQRPERARPERATPRRRAMPSFAEPVDIATLLADPTVGLPRDTTRFTSRDYEVHFQPDLISQPQVGYATGFGAFGASQLAFSDLLGDHNLLVSASVYGSVTDSDLFFSYANLKKRVNWGATAFQFRNDFLPLGSSSLGGSFLFRSDVYRGVQAFASYPFSRFRRIELGAVAAHIDRRIARFDIFDPTPNIEEDLDNQAYAAPSLAYVYDSGFFGSTGPIGGSRQRIEVQQAVGDRSFTQLYVDLRKYWFFDKRYTIAGRALFLGNYGEDLENRRFQSVGGPTLLRGFDYSREAALVGTEIGLVNLEFRFPVVERPVLGGSALPPIRGAVWYDIGYANCGGGDLCRHQRTFAEDDTWQFATSEDAGPLGFRLVDGRAAFGAGVRMNLFGFAVMRVDYALRTDMASVGEKRWVFTLAPEF